jgi:hypothetical protein
MYRVVTPDCDLVTEPFKSKIKRSQPRCHVGAAAGCDLLMLAFLWAKKNGAPTERTVKP